MFLSNWLIICQLFKFPPKNISRNRDVANDFEGCKINCENNFLAGRKLYLPHLLCCDKIPGFVCSHPKDYPNSETSKGYWGPTIARILTPYLLYGVVASRALSFGLLCSNEENNATGPRALSSGLPMLQCRK